MDAAQEAPSLRVQTVLFRNEPAQIWRLLMGLAAAARHAVAAGVVSRVEWALGDCTPGWPVLAPADGPAMTEAAGGDLSSVTYEFFDANLGSSGGHNRLALDHPSDLLITLNPDTYPSPTVLTELVGALVPGVGIAEARQLPMEHPKEYDPATGDTSWSSTCCVLVRRPIFDALEGFDHDHFPLYCDDVDFSWRVKAAGQRVVVAPFATVFHDKRPRHDGVWPASDVEVYHSTLGRLMLATRWDRPDILAETIAWIGGHGHPKQREALADYEARAAAGTLPEVIPGGAGVAQFTNGEYAVHRF